MRLKESLWKSRRYRRESNIREGGTERRKIGDDNERGVWSVLRECRVSTMEMKMTMNKKKGNKRENVRLPMKRRYRVGN